MWRINEIASKSFTDFVVVVAAVVVVVFSKIVLSETSDQRIVKCVVDMKPFSKVQYYSVWQLTARIHISEKEKTH